MEVKKTQQSAKLCFLPGKRRVSCDHQRKISLHVLPAFVATPSNVCVQPWGLASRENIQTTDKLRNRPSVLAMPVVSFYMTFVSVMLKRIYLFILPDNMTCST
jgi:hypothetical protein